ncbi:MAG TPA: metallophosphoesterase, partial [Lachnospiraceae bacterium]|nr:metallophosphoesterase [Lachnospiraceae bacterium]
FDSHEYDVDRVIKDMDEAKLHEHAPYWSCITRSILRGGNVSHSKVLSRAMELCRENTRESVWPNIEEKFWEQAVNELIKE